MGDKAQVVQQLDQGIWREFVEKHPLANIFHTPEMFEVFSRAKGHQPQLWAAVEKNAQPLALLLPVQITLINDFFRPFTTRAIAYGSVLYEASPQGYEALDILLMEYARQTKSILYTEMRNLNNLNAIQPVLQAHNFQYEEQLNYLIRLNRPVEEVLQAIGSRTRTRIKRSLRRGSLSITEIGRREELGLFYELESRSYRMAGVPLAHKSLFEAAFDLLIPKRMVKFLLAWIEDDCVAASAELIYKDMIFGWYSGVDRSFSAFVPNEIFMWHILKWGADKGMRVYDFGGAGRSNEHYGVRDFKVKFGGELVSFGRNILVHSQGRLAISKVGYRVYQHFIRLKPLS